MSDISPGCYATVRGQGVKEINQLPCFQVAYTTLLGCFITPFGSSTYSSASTELECQEESAPLGQKGRMRNLKENGISEAKKAPFKIALGTEAFSASESTFISTKFRFVAFGALASERSC